MANASLLQVPDAGVTVRLATPDDLTFIDELQKTQRHALGFMFLEAIAGKIERGEILVAWAPRPCFADEENTGEAPVPLEAERVGYCIGSDRYFKHDDIGIIYQMNVVPGRQRQFIATALLKAMFDNAAYGCKLYCCWCAQDLKANYFWEAMGFVPLAYRGGSEKKSRVHIFWQKRIREGDVTTPWWYPSKTDGGAMRADRIALPIPPGKHWSDEMPVVEVVAGCELRVAGEEKKRLPRSSLATGNQQLATVPPKKPRIAAQFGGPPTGVMEPVVEVVEEKVEEKPKAACPELGRREKVKRVKAKADPKLIAAARELRDRWLEHVNARELLIEAGGKYDVVRKLPYSGQWHLSATARHMLPAA